jgi:tight adherence protein C
MDPVRYAALSFLVVAGVSCLAGVFLLWRWFALRAERLRQLSPQAQVAGASILRWEEEARGWLERVLERLGRVFRPRDKIKVSRVRQRLVWAGYQNPRAVTLFIGAKMGLAILSGYAYTLYGLRIQQALPYVLPYSIILAGLGFFLPNYWLRRRIRARQREIIHALPNVLDLLMVCVEAGMGFDAAVARIAEQPEVERSPLHQELLRMHLEMRAGRPRAEGLHALGERTGVDEVKAVVGAFIQTERLGTSLGKTLRVHAESARVKRRHRAEELAQLAPLKMLFPTALFLFPVFFLVTLAPSLMRLIEAFRGVGLGVR